MYGVALGPTLALAFALTCVPALLVARAIANSRQARSADPRDASLARQLARLMRIVGLVLFLGAAAMVWAGDASTRIVMVVLGVALTVNLLAVAMLVTVVRARGGGKLQ